MSVFLPLKRATLLVPSGPAANPDQKHLFILLNDPWGADPAARQVLMVSMSTVRPGIPHDATCFLYPGDHPFVKHRSYVVYQKPRLEGADAVLRGVKSGQLVPQDIMDSAMFARICKGLEESRQTPPRFLTFYRIATGQIPDPNAKA